MSLSKDLLTILNWILITIRDRIPNVRKVSIEQLQLVQLAGRRRIVRRTWSCPTWDLHLLSCWDRLDAMLINVLLLMLVYLGYIHSILFNYWCFYVTDACNTDLIISLITATVLAVLVAAFTAIIHIRYRKRTKGKLAGHARPPREIPEESLVEGISGDAHSTLNEAMVKRKFFVYYLE